GAAAAGARGESHGLRGRYPGPVVPRVVRRPPVAAGAQGDVAAAQPRRYGGAQLVLRVELQSRGEPGLLLAPQVDALRAGRLGGVERRVEAHRGVPEVAAGLLGHAVDVRALAV